MRQLHFRCGRRRRGAWRCLLPVISLAAGVVYAICLCAAEWEYNQVTHKVETPEQALEYLQNALAFFPFERRFRQGYVLAQVYRTNMAHNPPDLIRGCLLALEDGIARDPSDAVLLAYAVTFHLLIGEDTQAKALYHRFQRVAQRSALADPHHFRQPGNGHIPTGPQSPP